MNFCESELKTGKKKCKKKEDLVEERLKGQYQKCRIA